MHPRSALICFRALALWAALVATVCGKGEILNITEPHGEKLVLTCPFEATPGWCFLPVIIQAETPGKQAADWQVSVSTVNYSGAATLRSRFDFRARGGDVSHGSVLVPTGNFNDGTDANYVMFDAARAGGGHNRGNLNAGASKGGVGGKTTLATQATHISREYGPGFAILFNHEQAPGDWRAYCGFHNLYITAAEWEAMTPAARTAIRHWVRLGGQLILLDVPAGKSLADMGLPMADSGQETGAVSRGSITQQKLAAINEGGVKQISSIAENGWAGRAATVNFVRTWEQRDGSSFAMPSAKLAAGFMLVVVVGFAVLVGPLNVFVFASARRRHRLFFTTPLISLAAGGLLVASVVLSDGIGGKGVRYVWFENGADGENTGYIVQHQHSRCGAMFSTGFEIPEDAYFAPITLEPGELTGDFTAELAAGKVRADGPWFSSRRAQNFYLAAARPGRGRIEQSGTADRPVVTSAFDFPLDRIFWLAPDGKTWWQAGALAQGTATALTPCTAAAVQQALDEATATAPDGYGAHLTTASHRPGHFLALANQIAAIETHPGIRWQTHGFVTGPVVTP